MSIIASIISALVLLIITAGASIALISLICGFIAWVRWWLIPAFIAWALLSYLIYTNH